MCKREGPAGCGAFLASIQPHPTLCVVTPTAPYTTVRERRPGERLQDDYGLRFLRYLVGAHDVRVGELLEQAPLSHQGAHRPPILETIGARRLGDNAARSLLAPRVVDVEVVAPDHVGYYLVAGRETLPCDEGGRTVEDLFRVGEVVGHSSGVVASSSVPPCLLRLRPEYRRRVDIGNRQLEAAGLENSDAAMTLRRYAHVLEDMREDAALTMDKTF
jgi:hypothetical protein